LWVLLVLFVWVVVGWFVFGGGGGGGGVGR